MLTNGLSKYLDQVYARENCSGFVMNPESFSTGLVLPFTHKRTKPKRKHTDLVMSPEVLNPESKVGTLNPKTFESGKEESFAV